jgi:hypothetical protein
MIMQQAIGSGERATDLAHEEIIRMRGRSHNLDTSRCEVDHEHGVERH